MQMAEMGNDEEARKYFARSLVLRTKMIDLLIDILHELNIEVIVSPYEADSQIAYLVRTGYADFAISEDSDLIAYGCPRCILKLDFMGKCLIFDMEAFQADERFKADKSLGVLQSLSKQQFIHCCIMGGCEYLPSIQQVGLKVALRLFAKHNTLENVI